MIELDIQMPENCLDCPMCDGEYGYCHVDCNIDVGIEGINKRPTDCPLKERKKGKFIGTEYDGYADGNPVPYEWQCSECGCVFEEEEPTYNFCPNCGADMRGEQDGD